MAYEPHISGPGDPVEAILGKTSITRKGTDGTTVVFYRFADAARLDKIADELANPKINDDVQQLNNKPYDVLPVNEETRAGFKEAWRQIEGIADIRFYDIDTLTPEERTALATNCIDIPNEPDMDVYRANLKGTMVGVSELPRVDAEHDPLKVRVQTKISENVEERDRLRLTILHEVMHSLGFTHPFRDEDDDDNKPVLNDYQDTNANTVLSYKEYDNYGTLYQAQHYQELDVAALQRVYGTSKQPIEGYAQMLAQEEASQKRDAKGSLKQLVEHDRFVDNALFRLDRYNQNNYDLLAKQKGTLGEKELRDLFTAFHKNKDQLQFGADQAQYLDAIDPRLGEVTLSVVDYKHGKATVVAQQQTDDSQDDYPEVELKVNASGLRYLDKTCEQRTDGEYVVDYVNPAAGASPEIRIGSAKLTPDEFRFDDFPGVRYAPSSSEEIPSPPPTPNTPSSTKQQR